MNRYDLQFGFPPCHTDGNEAAPSPGTVSPSSGDPIIVYAPSDDMFAMSELIPVENRPYQIGELAEKFGVTLRTIRFYEQKGLMKPRRIGANMRIFDAADVARLGLIVACRRFRFTVDEIAALLALRDRLGVQEFGAHLVVALKARRTALIEEIEETEKVLGELSGFLTGLDHRA